MGNLTPLSVVRPTSASLFSVVAILGRHFMAWRRDKQEELNGLIAFPTHSSYSIPSISLCGGEPKHMEGKLSM